MGEYRRLALLVLIMIGVCVIVAATAIGVIYEAALDRERARLVNIAQSQARLMEALAHLEAPARTEGEQPSAGALSQPRYSSSPAEAATSSWFFRPSLGT